jgi:membrane protein implicated in regulation of membrane protease activity
MVGSVIALSVIVVSKVAHWSLDWSIVTSSLLGIVSLGVGISLRTELDRRRKAAKSAMDKDGGLRGRFYKHD